MRAPGAERRRRSRDPGLPRVAQRRSDPVRDGGRRRRPRGGARSARLSNPERLRDLLRGNARAGLPRTAPALGANCRARRADAPRHLLLRSFRRQRAAVARRPRQTLRARTRLRALVPELADTAASADRGVERAAGRGHAGHDVLRRRPRRPDPVPDTQYRLSRSDPAARRRRRARRVRGARAAAFRRWTGEPADVLVDLVQRALGRTRRERPVGHLPRRLRYGPTRALSLRVRLRAGPRRAAVQSGAGPFDCACARPRRRGRPAGSCCQRRGVGSGDAEGARGCRAGARARRRRLRLPAEARVALRRARQRGHARRPLRADDRPPPFALR